MTGGVGFHIVGSMDGPRIRSAQTALLVFLKSLPPGCYFNIIGFGSTFELLFSELVLFVSCLIAHFHLFFYYLIKSLTKLLKIKQADLKW